MGLNIREIVPRKEILVSDLRGKVIAVDAFNAIYQFLSSIRQYDGTPLMDKKGRITSHLSGLFYRNITLLGEGIRLVYVFDGKPPKMKFETNDLRRESKEIAKERYEEAKKKEDYDSMRKYSQQLSKIDESMIEESKELLEAMGISVIQAPSEGEAQASELSKHKEVYAVASQDYDCLLFGAPRLIQNLTLARKRKTVSGFIEINPELIELERVLNHLQINYDQLITLGILTGTDYNPGGVKGIGPKKALQLVQKYKTPVEIFNQFKDIEFDWKEVFELFKKPDVDKHKEIKFPVVNYKRVKEILLEHDFSEERIDKQIEKLINYREKNKQKTLF
ncbi:MAG: flap endonuclease-1 [Candidatus Pacearchaeota archaeon]